MNIIKKGSNNNDVKTLQSLLHLAQDGIFGEITNEAVIAFQKENGLTPDGIVGDSTWKKLLGEKKVKRNVNKIILHCTATPEGKDYTVTEIREWHKQRGFNDIGYHWVIYRDGTIAKGRDESIIGAHCSGQNTGSIGISYVGGLDKDGKTAKDTRTDKQKIALFNCVNDVMKRYNVPLSSVYCHNQFANKACPSFKIETFDKEFIKYNK